MDAAAFERVYEAFGEFHSFFAPLFGRRESRDHSRNYLRALLVQSQDRRNAGNLSESVGVPARAMQRFLTAAPWDDDAVMGRLQEYLAPRLGHSEAVWVLDGSDFPKQGRKVGGGGPAVLWQVGQGGQLPGRDVPGVCQSLGPGAGGPGALPAGELDIGTMPGVRRRGVPEDKRRYRSKTELALELLQRALARGHLKAGCVAGDDAFGMSPSFRDGLAALGMRYVLDVPGNFTFWPVDPEWTSPAYQGFGRPRKPRLRSGQRRTLAERGAELPEDAWREITVAQGSQGPRTYMFSAQRVRPTSRRKPGEIHWAIWRRNLDGSEPRYYLSNAPGDTPLETLAYVGGSRWRIETEFETEKSDVGLDEYEDPHLGWLASSHCAVPAGGSLPVEPATGLGGKRCPGSAGPKSTGWCGRCCPGNGWVLRSCCGCWRRSSCATIGPAALTPNAAPPSGRLGTSLRELSL